MAGLFFLIMAIRLLIARRVALTPQPLVLAAVIASLSTVLVEFTWYGLVTGVNPWRIAKANLLFSFGVRPAVIVLLAGLAVAAFAAFKNLRTSSRKQAA